ncbi:MAG: lipid-A-disaccharide synthase [Deltaproteobacteria bacterium]|nr:lipid-A-disaccharide synthase [Deltaproteobacteria bacterium]
MSITKSDPRKVMIVAGEASGDLHGANLVRAMHAIDSSLEFYGVGGPKMKAAGVLQIADAADMAVVGLTEVFSKLGMILRVMRRLKKSLLEERPALVILIDYPDFNMPLAKAATKKGFKVFYYISPQVWAWRRGRIGQIKKYVAKMAVILPFEAEMYHQAGVDAVFVGHPLLDVVKTGYTRPEALHKFNLKDGTTTVGILPGSRLSEVTKLLPEMLKTAVILKEELPAVQFVLPLADTLDQDYIAVMLQPYQEELDIRIIRNEIYDALAVCDAAMVASGTATLETALIGTPMIIVYKMSPFSFLMGRLFVNVSHIGLANIIAGRTIVPELIQGDANPERMAKELLAILTDEERKTQIRKDLSGIREKLGSPGAAERAAQSALEII